MWELDYKESWVLKNWCFWTMVLEKTLESSLDCKEIKHSTVKEISPKYSLEGLMLKLKLQYFGHLVQRTDSLERPWCRERLKAGGEGDDRRRDGWMASPMQWIWVWIGSRSLMDREACNLWGHKLRHKWTELTWVAKSCVTIFVTPWTVALQAPLSMGFPRQENWRGLPFPFPGHLPDQDQTQVSCTGRQILYHWVTREAPTFVWTIEIFAFYDKTNEFRDKQSYCCFNISEFPL